MDPGGTGVRPDFDVVLRPQSIRMTSTMEFAPTTETTAVAKGWHADPLNQHDLRFHDGRIWTEHVTHFGPVPCNGCKPINHTR